MKLELKNISGPLPTSNFELLEDENIIGNLQLRHTPSKSSNFPDGFESHIYYEINPEHRGKGYGTKILSLGLQEAENLGLKEVILTCREDNLPSRKIIKSNGGKLIDKKLDAEGTNILKFNIVL